MPVFFYIDPDYDEDPELEFDDHIQLAYTFFEAREGMSLPLPGFMRPAQTPENKDKPETSRPETPKADMPKPETLKPSPTSVSS